MSPSTEEYDFFVSYARSDNANGWITNFVEELLAEHRKFTAGRELTYFIDKQEIGAGADWQHTLNHGIAHSKLFVAFISPNYFASEWCRKEWRAWIDAEIAKHILTAGVRPVYIVEVPGLTDGKLSDQDLAKQIAVFLKLSDADSAKLLAETPPVVKHLRRRQMTHNQPFCDVHSFYTEGVDTLRRDDLRQVLSKLAQDLNHHAELLAKADASDTTIPPYNRNFSGRLDELLQLREWLDKDDRTGVIHGVHGLGGIGKTELALTYAHGYASAYPGGRFLIQCDGKLSLREAILAQQDFKIWFADRISDEQRKDAAEHYAAILFHLGRRMEQLGHVLLLLDNVTDLALLAPEQADALTKLGPKLHLLATTRLHAPPTHSDNWISLDRLPDDDALELLEKHRPFESVEDREAAWQIVKRLDGFTLAVELTAAFLAANQSTSYARMSTFLELDDLEEMADDSDVKLVRHNHERRLSAVLGPVLDGLKPAERRFMEYAALFPPDQVPLPWLKELVTQDFPELAQKGRLKNPWDEVWQKLEKLSLISRAKEETAETPIFRVHRLVQELVLRGTSKTTDLEALQTEVEHLTTRRLTSLMKASQLHDIRWELKPLAALAMLWADSDSLDTAIIIYSVGNLFSKLSEWSEAEHFFRHALAIYEQNFGPDHPDVVTSLNSLASVLHRTNRLTEAEQMFRRALAIYEQNFGFDHPDVAKTLNFLALSLHRTNRFAEAELLLRRALTICEQNFGPDHPDVATSLNYLALSLHHANRITEAEQMFRRALAICEQNFGSNHPDVGSCLNSYATLLMDTNRMAEAEQIFRRVLAIYEQNFGPDHPDVAKCQSNLAVLLKDTNRTAEAEQMFRRALTICEQSLGPDHPNVGNCLNSLAELLLDTGSIAEAEQLFRRTLAIYEQNFGPDHPDVATSLNSLATVLHRTNRLTEAEQILRSALAIYEQSFAPDHPNIESCLNRLAALLMGTRRMAEAEQMLRRALAICELRLGSDHPNVAASLNSLALLLHRTNRLTESEQLFCRALVIYERGFGPDHPDTARCQSNLATLFKDTNRIAEAEQMFRRALMAKEQSFGSNHHDVALTMNHLAVLLKDSNRITEAEQMFRRALAIYEQNLGPDHTDVSRSLSQLALLLYRTNRIAEAIPLCRRALDIIEQNLGPDHSETKVSRENLVTLLFAANKKKEAKQLLNSVNRATTGYLNSNPTSYPSGPLTASKANRNDPCPCGSNKKYKKCCGA